MSVALPGFDPAEAGAGGGAPTLGLVVVALLVVAASG